MNDAVSDEGTASRRPGARELQRIRTRTAVIDAAIELFAQRGFDGTSLPAIAQASGVPVPLAMYHFGSKEGLWREAVALLCGRVEEHIQGFASQLAAAQGLEFYRIAARAHITALAAHPEYMRILFQEGTQHSDRLEWLVANHQSRLSAMQMAVIQRAQAEGLFPPMDLVHAKFLVSGMFSLPIVLAPEYSIATGADSLAADFIEQHIDACLRLLFPNAFTRE